MNIPFLNLELSNVTAEAKLIDTLKSEKINWILGEQVQDFESQWSKYMGVKYSVGVSNGLDGLEIALQALILNGKLCKGDKILLQANAYFACALALVNVGLRPILYDVDINKFELDVENLDFTGVSGILIVHMYGKSFCTLGDYEKLYNKGVVIIEDCSQSHGLKLSDQNIGSLSDISVWSMYPTKNLGAIGDAGIISTNDESLSTVLKMLRNYGKKSQQEFFYLGKNARLDTIQAIFLSQKLLDLDSLNFKRIQIAKKYSQGIRSDFVKNISGNWIGTSVYHLYIVMVQNRIGFMDYLKSKGIQTEIHYGVELCHQLALKDFTLPSFVNTKILASQVVSLPIWPGLSEDQISYIIDAINSYVD